MKALTLTQPWASLVAIGAKAIETRGWQTKHRGELAIHAAKGFPRWAQDACYEEPFFSVLRGRLGAPDFDVSYLPLGAVVAVVELVDVVPTDHPTLQHTLTADEAAFGDYAEGRHAWLLRYPRRLVDPIPARGFQHLWNASDELAAAVRAEIARHPAAAF